MPVYGFEKFWPIGGLNDNPKVMKYHLLLLFFIAGKTLLAQDSSFVRRMQKIGQDAAHRNKEVYNRGKISILQQEALENAKRLNQTIRIFLKEGVDTTGINNVL